MGDLPYVDAYDVNTPGIMLLHWGWGMLAGFTDGAFLGLALGLSTLAVFGALWALRDEVPPEALLLGLFVGLWAFTRITPWDRGQRELFQGVLLLAAIGLRARPLAAGLLAGAAVTIKIAVLPVIWLVWMTWIVEQVRARRPGAVRDTLLSFAGFVVAPAGVFVWLYAVGALEAFLGIQQTYLPLHNQVLRVPALEALAKPLPIAVLTLGIVTAIRGPRVLAAALLGNIAIYLYQAHGWTYHLQIAVPLMAPAAALAARDLPARVPVGAALVAAIPVVMMLHYDLTDGRTRATRVDDHWDYPAHLEVAAYLKTHGPPTDRVLTNNDEHQLLYLARRRAATPFLYGFLFSESHPEPRLKQLGFARYSKVVARGPEWVVWNTTPYAPELDSLEANRALATWIARNCHLERRIRSYLVHRCRTVGP